MKKFVPGEIARAEDVNANFDELKQAIDKLTASRQQGRVALGQYQPGETYEKQVSFPRAFAKPPMVAISCSNQRLRLAIYNVTESGFTFYGWNDTDSPNADDSHFDWIALASID